MPPLDPPDPAPASDSAKLATWRAETVEIREGLIRLGLLHPAKRHDPFAVTSAVVALLDRLKRTQDDLDRALAHPGRLW